MKRSIIIFAAFLVVAAAATRVLRHFGFIDLPPNVAPIAALAMFGGTYLPRRLAFILPISAMIIADVMIGFYEPGILLSVYVSFLVSGFIGLWIRRKKNIVTVVSGSLLGSTMFFLVTNGAVWLFGSLYPHTGAGLISSYVAGLPFFRNTVLGDLGFVGFMFGMFELAVLFSGGRRVASGEVHRKLP